MTFHRMYGFLIDSEIPYGPEVERDAGAEPAWTVRWAPDDVDLDATPAGTLVVDRTVWPVYADGASFSLWSEGFGRFDVDADRRLVTVALADPRPDLAPLYMRGVIMSLALELQGLSVLHANSVLVGRSAVAFIGIRGAGKTTVTTALCAAGLHLLADDVVPIERNADGWSARSGYTDLRLRPSASAMIDLFDPAPPTSTSIDGRTVLHLEPAPLDAALLGAIVVPSPSDDHDGPDRVVPISGRDALVQLLGGFRVHNVLEPSLAARRLQVIGDLMAAVPVGRLEMPRRHTWDIGDACSVRSAVESWLEGEVQ